MNPKRILDIGSAFWNSAALLSANECGIFAALAEGPASAAEIAERTELPIRSALNLLDALVSLELLHRDDDTYRNAADTAAFLVPGKPGSLSGALRYNSTMFPAWAQLSDTLRTEKPAVPSPTYLGQDLDRTRAFVVRMHQRALAMGHAIVSAIDLTGRKKLIDVGGGPGTLSRLLCEGNSGLNATVFELPGIAAVGRELVEEAGLSDRVMFVDGDAFKDNLRTDDESYDAALVSGLLHREPEEICATFCKDLFDVVTPDGVVYLVDVMRDESRTGPAFAALFALNMMLTSERGGCHADAAHREWLEAAGFVDVHITRLPDPMVHTIVRARRP